jgi:hypothetical protein
MLGLHLIEHLKRELALHASAKRNKQGREAHIIGLDALLLHLLKELHCLLPLRRLGLRARLNGSAEAVHVSLAAKLV